MFYAHRGLLILESAPKSGCLYIYLSSLFFRILTFIISNWSVYSLCTLFSNPAIKVFGSLLSALVSEPYSTTGIVMSCYESILVYTDTLQLIGEFSRYLVHRLTFSLLTKISVCRHTHVRTSRKKVLARKPLIS